jgi:signal transduction histidine kinase/CheY-like chemotaxis protein/HPt (histidine-containing phosphotransfer) domain-containing protein
MHNKEAYVETGRVDNELKKIVYLCMIMATSILALSILILSMILGWEVWMIPVIVTGTAACWIVYIMNQASHRTQVYVCGVFAMFLVFYYCVKIKTVYDCGAVIVIMIFLFTFLGERLLILAGIAVSFAGLIVHLIISNKIEGLDLSVEGVIRTAMVFMLIPLSAILINRIIRAWYGAENKYIDQIDTLSKENERVNNFLANVSHEIRTPISAVIGLSYVLQKENLSDQDMSKIKSISLAGHRVSEQITDILDFTELDMGKMTVANDSYMICSMMNDLITELSMSDNYGLDLVVDIEPAIPSILIGDESKIKRVLWHLIRNGYKYTKDGGVYVRMSPIKREYGINLVIEVKDTGIGMSEEEIDNIYEKFYQLDSSRARASGGLGLGIPIVNGLTRSMDGLLSIESSLQEGTTVVATIPQKIFDSRPCISVDNGEKCVAAGFLGFMMTGHPKIREYYMQMIAHLSEGLSIPFYRVQTKDELEKLIKNSEVTHLFVGTGEYLDNKQYIDALANTLNVALIAAESGVGCEVGANITVLPKPFYGTMVASFLNHVFNRDSIEVDEIVTFPGVRALVVDDEHMNLIVAREIFSAYQMEITTASGGEEAIELCGKQDFDIVFMDHMMPIMDGVEAMHIIKRNAAKENKEIPVVALTANAISSAKEMFISEGFDGFVPKPIEISDLERVLRRLLPKFVVAYSKEKETIIKKEAEEKDYITKLKEAGVDTAYGLDYCGGDTEFYEELLGDYADKKDSKLEEIKGYFDAMDLKNYEIRVHGVKSTSKLIGAFELSNMAKALEDAAKGGNEAFIKEKHPEFMRGYETLMNIISEGGAL